MIVHTSIDDDGSVTVSIDSDGDQGDGYSPDVLADLCSRAGNQALSLWWSARMVAHSDTAE